MGRRTSYAPGIFCWVELGSTDPEASAGFYSAVMGWEIDRMEFGDGIYMTAKVDGLAAAGIYTNASDGWMTTISVEDCDASAERAIELGATLIVPPTEADSMGRMSIVTDPLGAVFTLWQPREMIGAEVVNQVGAFTMAQLNTRDPDKAIEFYTQLLGWDFESPGEDSGYWNARVDGWLNAGMMKNPQPGPDNWFTYFTSASLEASVARIEANGGSVVVPSSSVPAGSFVVARDNQGAAFGLFEGDVDD